MLDRCLYIPQYYNSHETWTVLPWSDSSLFGNDRPVAVEYCSGNGQWICEQAKRHPEWNWVAVEKRLDRARKIWRRMKREPLSNLFVVYGEGKDFTRYYAYPRSVFKAFINFPDPWPKLRHAKHRLIQEEFLQALKKILEPKGEVILATDDAMYLEQMTRLFALRWRSRFPPPHFSTQWPDYGSSFFHNLWQGKGRTIYYLHYEAPE